MTMDRKVGLLGVILLLGTVAQLSEARTVKNEKGKTVQYDILLYKEKNGQRMIEAIYHVKKTGITDMVDCFIIGDGKVGKELLNELPPEQTTVLEKADMLKKLSECTSLLLQKFRAGQLHASAKLMVPLSSGIGRGFFDSLLIFPGTNWCGAGNVAEGFNDLGPAVDTDICCRTHDHCNDSIPSGGQKYELKNKAIYTKSHCSCDKEFYHCLNNVDSLISNTVGCLYFNMLQVQCFERNHPIDSCTKYSGWIPWIHWSCQEYVLDYSKPKMWQFFDGKYYATN